MKSPQKECKEALQERTLLRIAEAEAMRYKAYLFGVVVDISEAFEAPERNGWAMKLKVIDSSFNFDSVVENEEIRFQNFAQIFFFGTSKSELPTIANVGDIVRLRRFNFFVNDKGELLGHMQTYSNWMVFPVNEGGALATVSCSMSLTKNANRELTNFEASKVQNLRHWVEKFFSTTSIRTVLWWSKLQEVDDAEASRRKRTAKNVDLIVKVQQVLPEQDELRFVDETGHKYIMFISNFPALMEKGKVVKLRAIDVMFTKNGRILKMNDLTSALLIPHFFFDYKLFSKEFFERHKTDICYRSPQIRKRGAAGHFETRKEVLRVYPFLDDFYFEDYLLNRKDLILRPFPKNICSSRPSIIKKEYNNKIPSVLGSFFSLSKKQLADVKFQKFVVNVTIASVDLKPFEEVAHTFCASCGQARKMSAVKDFYCCDHVLEICLVVGMRLTDESLDDDQTITAFIVTRSVRNNPFLLWRVLPSMNDYKSWSKLAEQEYRLFLNKFEALTRVPEKAKLVLEVKGTRGGKLFFELTDTLFLP